MQVSDSCQKRFLWTHKEVDLAPLPVVGLVLQVGDAESPHFLHFQFTKHGRGGGTQSLSS